MFKEFKEFALKGNVLDLAVGIVIGAAFNKVVTSFVNNVLMPPVGLWVGKVDFSNLLISLTGTSYASLAEAKAAGAPTINYGLFINTILDFLIVAFAVFLLVRQVNRIRRRPETAPPGPATKECPYCLTKIPAKAVRCPHCTSELEAR